MIVGIKPTVPPGPRGEIPSAGVVLRDTSSYLPNSSTEELSHWWGFHFMCVAANASESFCMAHLANNELF